MSEMTEAQRQDVFGALFKATERRLKTTKNGWGDERFGQALFNEAISMYGAHADELRGSDVDCFYDDKKVERFLDALYQNLQRAAPQQQRE